MNLPVAIQQNWRQELKTGLYWSAVFIVISLIFPQLTIGIPVSKPASLGQDATVTVAMAPIVEELLFRFALLNSLILLHFPVIIVVLLLAGAFSLFHYTAYGASLAAQNASFVGAFIFGTAVAFIALRKRSVVTPIIIHATFNLWILIRLYVG